MEVSEALAGMNEVLMSGFSELSEEQKSLVVSYVMNKENWAKYVKPRAIKETQTYTSEASSTYVKSETASNIGSDSNVFSVQLGAVMINTSSNSLVVAPKQSFELR